MIDIDMETVSVESVYEAFEVAGKEAEALNDIYFEMHELIGCEAMLKLFKYFRGDKMDFPMKLYKPDFIADLVDIETDRRARAKIARAAGYSARFIENMLSKRKNGDSDEHVKAKKASASSKTAKTK